MKIWVEIENLKSQKVGEVHSVLDWEQTDRLDRAGSFKVTIPATERNLSLIGDKFLLRCFGSEWGKTFSLGCGIVDSRQISYRGSDPAVIEIGGDNLLVELSYRIVKKLEIYKDLIAIPTVYHYENGNWWEKAGGVGSFWINGPDSFLLIGHDDTFNIIDFEITQENDESRAIEWSIYVGQQIPHAENQVNLNNIAVATLLKIIRSEINGIKNTISLANSSISSALDELYDLAEGINSTTFPVLNNSNWSELEESLGPDALNRMRFPPVDWGRWLEIEVEDGTIPEGKDSSFRQSGSVSFERPSGWIKKELADKNKYWCRFRPQERRLDVITATIKVRLRIARDFLIRELLEPYYQNWKVSERYSDRTRVLISLKDEAVLSSLVLIAERADDHFRLAGDGTRTIDWLQDDDETSIVAKSHVNELTKYECFIESIRKSEDSFDVISRIYPYGAGQGDDKITLAHCTDTVPAGYSINKDENYIQNDELINQGIVIEAIESFSNIRPVDKSLAADPYVSNELLRVAIARLQEADKIYRSYKLSVASKVNILPGMKIRIEYIPLKKISALDIIEDVYVLEATRRVKKDGFFFIDLVTANQARWPKTEIETIMMREWNSRLLEKYGVLI